MKQNLKIGNMVDDGTGDYLRLGGEKINNNFDDLFYQLGDGENPHAAGAWKTHAVATDGGSLTAVMGHSYTVNTAGGRCNIQLPKGTPSEYNFVIRFRDVFSTWQTNPVTISPAVGDTIKGSPNAVEIKRNLADLEMVYCSPGRWEYIDNKSVDRIVNNTTATVARQDFIATDGQTDFTNIFPFTYNSVALEVTHRGNTLYYGKDGIFDAANAEFGSIGTAPGQLVKLDGKTIRLRMPCVAGDTVIVKAYQDGLGQWRSSYNRREIRMLDSRLTDRVSIDGSLFVGDLAAKKEFTIAELGISASTPINPNACEVRINTTLQSEAGTADLPTMHCVGAEGDDFDTCTLNGGNWETSFTDYLFNYDENNRVDSISFDKEWEHGDTLSLIWYNNDIGTTIDLPDIIQETNGLYVSQGPELYIDGRVRITDYDNPFAPNIEPVAATNVVISSTSILFDLFHPIGTIYENTVNPNNPASYMGFGQWQRLEDRVTVGWSSVPGSRFNLNNNDRDVGGAMHSTAGGTGGDDTIALKANQIPKLTTDDTVLIADPNGPIVVGGCMIDPDAQGPAYTKYREGKTTVNKINDPTPAETDIMNPYLVVYRWVRVA